MPGVRIVSFEAFCGLADNILQETPEQKADFWVLVDGIARFSLRRVSPQFNAERIHIDLDDEDRFLTLLTTDGGDGTGTDWCIFAEPVLELN